MCSGIPATHASSEWSLGFASSYSFVSFVSLGAGSGFLFVQSFLSDAIYSYLAYSSSYSLRNAA